jgi:hypothetical protein
MTNPFAEDETTTPETEAVTSDVTETVEENLDVDTPELDEVSEGDETDAPEATTAAEKPAKKEKAPKAPARPPVPEGYITPVTFAKLLTEKALEAGGKEVPPQYVYSTIRSSASGKNPLKTYSEGGRDNLLKPDEAFAWWEAKELRKTERAANAADKAEKAANKAKTTEQALVETGEAGTAPVEGLEEAE